MTARRLAESSTRNRWVAVAVGVWAILGIVLLTGLAFWALLQIRVIFPPLILAVALIVLLNPVVTWLQRRRIPRVVGTLLMYTIFFGAIVLVLVLIVPPISQQIQELRDNWPRIQQQGLDAAQRFADRYGITFDEESVNQLVESARDQAGEALKRITEITAGALHVMVIFVLAPILALYLLIDLPRLRDAFVRTLPPPHRDEWLMLLGRCGQAVSAFFRGQLLVALIVAILSSVLLSIVKVPFAVPIGLIAGVTNIIPFVGPFIGGGIAVIVGGITGGMDKALLAAGAMLAVQQLDNHLISPNVMGRAVKLHPVSIILALLGGGTLAGVLGMLMAVPTLAVAKILVMHYYSKHVLGVEPLDEPAGEPPVPPADQEMPPVAVEAGAER
ncbi:MAG: AI-2E family transporter [Actinomycetota bacterium]